MSNKPDIDPQETQEWLDALEAVLENEGVERAHFLLERLIDKARRSGAYLPFSANTAYLNTIPVTKQERFPGDRAIEQRIRSFIRWNAMAMVVQANRMSTELGGHISSFASSATLYDVGFNHFFRARNEDARRRPGLHPGPLGAGHLRPRLPRRAPERGPALQLPPGGGRRRPVLLPASLADARLSGSSRPCPWGWDPSWPSTRRASCATWTTAAWSTPRAARSGPSAATARWTSPNPWAPSPWRPGSGWTTWSSWSTATSSAWTARCAATARSSRSWRRSSAVPAGTSSRSSGGSYWDPLLARDKQGLLLKRMEECVDGDYQAYKAKGGAYTRKHFFGKYPELADMVANMTDDDIWRLNRGGHDPIKVYAAYAAAMRHKGQPTVILAKTVKGYGMGNAGEGMNITHSQKKMGEAALKAFRDRFNIPISDDQIGAAPFYKPAADSPEMQYLHERREALGGSLPARRPDAPPLKVPDLDDLRAPAGGQRRPRDVHHHGLRAPADHHPAGQGDRAPGGAHHPGRGAHLRHGGHVPPARHLLLRRPALRAGGRRPGHVLPRGQEGSDPPGGHQRGRRHVVLDRRRHGLRQPRPGHDPLLHLLLHVRLPARRRPGLGGRRPARPRLPHRRHRRAHHPGRRGAAAPGRPQPDPGIHHPQLRRLRPGLRLRAGGDRPGRHAAHVPGAGVLLLLHHRDERELRPAGHARGVRRGHPQGHAPGPDR